MCFVLQSSLGDFNVRATPKRPDAHPDDNPFFYPSHFISSYVMMGCKLRYSTVQPFRQLLIRTTPAYKRSVKTHAGAMKATALADVSKEGAFVRTVAQWRDTIVPGTKFEPEADRYHLYISYACPWANRALAVLKLKGLDHVIGVSVTHPTWQRTKPDDPKDEHCGWVFRDPSDPPLTNPAGHGSFPCDACIPDTINGAKTVRDLYELAGQEGGRYTVPVLWDKKLKTIVNNESSEIIRILNTQFNSLAKHPELDLYPEALRSEIDAVNEWVYPQINNGVYRCGFATKQGAYEEAFRELFSALDRCEEILSRQRYIAGSQLTEADVRLFMTLIRFDEVYVVYFKTNKAFIREYPNISNYVRELYQIPAIGSSINMSHIKVHYFTSHPHLNAHAIVPLGGRAWWEEPHDRATKKFA